MAEHRWRVLHLHCEIPHPKPYVVVRTLESCGAIVTRLQPHVDARGRLIHFARFDGARRATEQLNESTGAFAGQGDLL